MTSPSGSGNNASRLPGYDLQPGQVVLNTWEVLEPLGRGGMGAVYRVYHRFMQKEMAMKTLRPDQVTDVTWKRFQIEAKAIAKLTHPNIVQIFDMGTCEEGQPFYTMELLDGQGLDDWIYSQSLTVSQGIYVFRQVAAALAFAHERGIVHRDIKPANIVLIFTQENKPPVVKVVDFGIARLGLESQGLTQEGEVCGSPLYMSPEQASGLKVDARSDIYSLGCAFFETLTGLPPFKGKSAIETMMMHLEKTPPTIESVRPDLAFPEGLSLALQMMLAKNPDERYSNAFQITQDLLQIERGLGAKVIARLTAGQKLRKESAESVEPEELPDSQGLIRPAERNVSIAGVVREKPSSEVEEAYRDSGEFEAAPVASPWKRPGVLLLGAGGLIVLFIIAVVVAVTAVWAALSLQRQPDSVEVEDELSARRQERLNFLFPKRKYFYISQNEIKTYREIGMIFDEGRRYYHFSSLTNECIGDIGRLAPDGSCSGWRPAIGVVVISDSVKIAFRPSKYLLAHPKLWQKFRDEDLQAISFPRLGRSRDKDFSESRFHFEKADFEVRDNLDEENIQEFGRFRELESLDFGDVMLFPENTNSLVEALNKFSNLRALTFDIESAISTSAILNLNCLRLDKLSRLQLPAFDNLSPLIARIGKSRSIESLSIQGSDTTLSDFEIIAGMRQLQELDMRKANIQKGSIGKLSALPKLEILSLVGAFCPEEEAGEFLKLRHLKTLRISLDVWGANSRLLAKIEKKLKENGTTVNIDGEPFGH